MTPPLPHALALVCAGLFAGGAMMQSIVDHPARLGAESAAGIDQMQRSLRHADPYMPLLAVVGAGMAIWSYLVGAGLMDLLAALLLVAVVPFTWALILPVNRRIHAFKPGDANVTEVAGHLRRWGRFHAFRSVSGTLALMLLAGSSILESYVV
ncbi:DUF1772 domain-containing protein [Sphingomonas sp.]|uniref:DUF1772 domain-containing protein n=1 Tax=Sphingomonas sp. TaxID=28214 RepID=UPI0035BBF697